jgi:hypothetical protein
MPLESFRHWQSVAIKQKQTASALLLGLSGAALAFSVTQLAGASTYIGACQSLLFHLSAAAQLISIACGIAFSLNRVRDFDLTSNIARTRENQPSAPRLKNMRERVRRLGRITRTLFMTQSVSFFVGAVFFVAFVMVRHARILYPA